MNFLKEFNKWLDIKSNTKDNVWLRKTKKNKKRKGKRKGKRKNNNNNNKNNNKNNNNNKKKIKKKEKSQFPKNQQTHHLQSCR